MPRKTVRTRSACRSSAARLAIWVRSPSRKTRGITSPWSTKLRPAKRRSGFKRHPCAPALPAKKPSGPEKVPNVGGKLTWYLDYKKCGEIRFDGKTERTTLAPLGNSPLVIGGRNIADNKVDRGFRGLLDEFRFSAAAVPVAEFVRLENKAPQRLVQAQVFYPVRESTDLARFLDREATGGPKSVLPAPKEMLEQETVGLAGLPTAFAQGGFIESRRRPACRPHVVSSNAAEGAPQALRSHAERRAARGFR